MIDIILVIKGFPMSWQVPHEGPYAKLKGIRGVGPKNAELLAAAGYGDIQAVQELYLGKCSRDQQLFRQHLQVSKVRCY